MESMTITIPKQAFLAGLSTRLKDSHRSQTAFHNGMLTRKKQACAKCKICVFV